MYEACVKVYHLESDEVILLIEDLSHTKSISKEACVLSIDTEDEVISFNLSSMTKE